MEVKRDFRVRLLRGERKRGGIARTDVVNNLATVVAVLWRTLLMWPNVFCD